MKLSIVVPLLNEEGSLPDLVTGIISAISNLGVDYELILVDDGSTDGSWSVIQQASHRNPQIKGIQFSKNFGHQFALTAGLDRSMGDAVIVMDADLQHPPEFIGKLLDEWKNGFEIVHTLRIESQDVGFFKSLTSKLFYRIFRKLTGIHLPSNAADFRLFDRKVVESLKQMRERTRFLRGLTCWVGYRSTSVPYQASERRQGQSKYHFRKMLRLAVDGIVSFSTLPLITAIYLGFLLAGAGFLYAGYAFYSRFLTGNIVTGWTSMIMLSSIVGGIQLIVLGMIGIYLGKIYDEVKQRPLYLIRESVGFTVGSNDA